MSVSLSLGERVRDLRHERGWTLADLANGAGVSTSFVNDIEHDRTTPSLKTLVRIAQALGMSVTQLLAGTRPYDLNEV